MMVIKLYILFCVSWLFWWTHQI